MLKVITSSVGFVGITVTITLSSVMVFKSIDTLTSALLELVVCPDLQLKNNEAKAIE
jgi:hypothetical protein